MMGACCPLGSPPTLQGEGDELYGVWDVHLHQVVHILTTLICGHTLTSIKKTMSYHYYVMGRVA